MTELPFARRGNRLHFCLQWQIVHFALRSFVVVDRPLCDKRARVILFANMQLLCISKVVCQVETRAFLSLHHFVVSDGLYLYRIMWILSFSSCEVTMILAAC